MFEKSEKCFAAAAAIPGRSLTRSKAPGRYYPVGKGPLYALSGNGAMLTTVDGQVLIDMVCALGAISLGYGHENVWPIIGAVRSGWIYSLPHPAEALAADALLYLCAPWATYCRFVKTGSESLHAAVMVARSATRRPVVLVADNAYHGWHDWVQATWDGGSLDRPGAGVNQVSPTPGDVLPNGVPRAYSESIAVYRYGDMDHLTDLARRIGENRIAAVLVEPARWQETTIEWLEGVRAWCDTNGSLMVMDEMIYGCRWRHGGGSEYYRVTPDLACFGKAIANGAPIAAVVGNDPLRKHGEMVSGTYSGDVAALEAVRVTLAEYADRNVIDTLWDRGEQLMDGLDKVVAAHAGMFRDGAPVHQRVRFTEPGMGHRFSEAMMRRGVLWHPDVVNVCAALTPDMVDRVVKAAADAADEVLR
jgi:glutamate-1-semialdehyde aminotransferase